MPLYKRLSRSLMVQNWVWNASIGLKVTMPLPFEDKGHHSPRCSAAMPTSTKYRTIDGPSSDP